MTLLPLIGWLLYIGLCVWYNYYLIEVKKKRPNYTKAIIWRCFWGGVFIIWANPGFDPGINPFGAYFWIQIWSVLPTAVYEATSFYLLFDPGLSIARGLGIFYRGKDSGLLDKSPLWVYYSLKILCAIALPISIIILMR